MCQNTVLALRIKKLQYPHRRSSKYNGGTEISNYNTTWYTDNDTAMLGRGLHMVAEIMRVYKQLIRSKSNGQKKRNTGNTNTYGQCDENKAQE